MRAGLWSAALVAALCVTGCYRSAVRGEVFDLEGQTLPGVAVSVENTAFQDVTNGVGHYSVRYNPGKIRLYYRKTGYTPAVVELEAKGPWPVDAPKVTLWHLPENKGVFFFENSQYQPTEPTEPRRYSGGLYGTEDWPKEAVTTNAHPRLIAFHLPLEGVSLVRMKFVEAVPEGTEAPRPVEVWAPDVVVPLAPSALDEPEHLLVDIRYDGKLEPGTYAVHWGALSGSREPVPSIYLFTIESETPPAPPQAESVSPEEVPDGNAQPENKEKKSDDRVKPKEAKAVQPVKPKEAKSP